MILLSSTSLVASPPMLFVDPPRILVCVLLLQPTNHLDLEACVWLEDYLSKFKRILLMVSHR